MKRYCRLERSCWFVGVVAIVSCLAGCAGTASHDRSSTTPVVATRSATAPDTVVPRAADVQARAGDAGRPRAAETRPPAALVMVHDLPIRVLFPAPSGPGRHPAIVILHDCSGLGPRSSGAPLRWANELTQHGYVVLIPDSFGPRGHEAGVCTESSTNRAEVNPARRVRDAYIALDYARELPEVDPERIGVMGGSHGGSTTLLAMVRDSRDSPTVKAAKDRGFNAAIALYPGCAMRMGGWRANGSGVYEPLAPLLILVGEKDDWTPAEPCRKLSEASRRAGYPVDIKIYPGAQHSFDSRSPTRYVAARVNANAVNGRGATTGGDPAAWADSIVQVEAFFRRHLNPMSSP